MRVRVWHRPGQGHSAERGHPWSRCALTGPVLRCPRLVQADTSAATATPRHRLLKMTGAVAGLENKAI